MQPTKITSFFKLQDSRSICSGQSIQQHHLPTTSETDDNNQRPFKKAMKFSAYSRYEWLERTALGYICKICCTHSAIKSGTWITDLVSLSASKKLSEKCSKHNESVKHKAAVVAAGIISGPGTHGNVFDRVIDQYNRQHKEEANSVKDLLRLAYYLFRSEIAHTTANWPALVATAASTDKSGTLYEMIANSPANAHRQSAKSVTGFLESFSEAISQQILQRLKNKDAFSVMADECTDINGREILSLIIRHIATKNGTSYVEEVFVSTVYLHSTTGEHICEILVRELQKMQLDPKNIAAVSFDGGANFSGRLNGVHGRLKEYSPNLLFIHCRNHLLQLALLQSCQKSPEVKRILNALNSLYTTFKGSHNRLSVLMETEKALDGECHKLIQPGATRWLSYDGSIKVVLKHHAAICIALEHIYVVAGNLSTEAGGLLLILRKATTVVTLVLLGKIFSMLSKLSKSLQVSAGHLTESLALVQVVLSSIRDISMDAIELEARELLEKAKEHNVEVENNADSMERVFKMLAVFKATVEDNLHSRFNDKFKALANFHSILLNKDDLTTGFAEISEICGVDAKDMIEEYKIYRRYPGDLHTQANILSLACDEQKKCMFPALSAVAKIVLLLPVGTAAVERSFSTMSRILRSERSRLLPEHVNDLMKISIEGPEIPLIRENDQSDDYSRLIDEAYSIWLKKPRR